MLASFVFCIAALSSISGMLVIVYFAFSEIEGEVGESL
jgi:hypothetical protein